MRNESVSTACSEGCFDRTARVPVDKTAALVASKGTRVEFQGKFTRPLLEKCPRVWSNVKQRCVTDDLTGRRFGRMTVIGLSKERPKLWACRCSCGLFEFRKAKAIKNPTNTWDCCEKCRKILHAGYCHQQRRRAPLNANLSGAERP